jgi:hypothetical protein
MMKGTIKIESNDNTGFSIAMNMSGVSKLDELLIFDALIDAFELTEADKTVFGRIIAAGGVRKVFGGGIDMVKMDMGLIGKLMKENNNDN